MIRIFTTRKNNAGKNDAPPDQIQQGLLINQEEINITDGGEFLDDGIRMTEQPFEGNHLTDEE